MKKFLNTFKKSEVAIYAIAIMLVAAGYLNYMSLNNNIIDTVSQDIENVVEPENQENVKNLVKIEETENTENNIVNENIDFEEIKEEELANIGDAELVSSNDVVETEENDYFANSKLDRDKTYASIISNYTAILEKDKVQEAEKKMAMEEITKINNTKNAIMICENVLSTKGFENSVIFVNDKSINVVVKVKEGLSKEKVAQIQNIVSRELNAELENIHITEK